MSPDQQTKGTDDNVPCPWCGKKQDLSALDIDVDSQVECDDCHHVYTVASLVVEVRCPKCNVPRALTLMEVSENGVTHCESCHRVFRPGDVASNLITNVVLERAS